MAYLKGFYVYVFYFFKRITFNKSNTKRKINETKGWLFEKINKFDEILSRLIKKKKRRNKLIISEINERPSLLMFWTLKGL